MIRTTGMRKVLENRLIVVWRDGLGRTLKQGKRIGKNCPITQEEARAYRVHVAEAVKAIRRRTGLGVLDSYRLLQEARDGNW